MGRPRIARRKNSCRGLQPPVALGTPEDWNRRGPEAPRSSLRSAPPRGPGAASGQTLASESESDIVQKLRKELQLLLAELKDRDKELNNMVAVHQRQFLAWEDNRQKILTLEERSSRLENELHKRNEMITILTQRLKLQNDCSSTLENTQQKFQEVCQKASRTSLQCQTLEDKNQTLVGSVMDLSNQVGQLQAREEELLTLLRLKDNDILEATSQITEFTSKFKKLESALCASKMEERNFNEEKQNFKLRLKEMMLEANRLKGDLSEKTKENSAQREEIIQLKQENVYLSHDLMLTAERASRKDQLLLSAKSKQLRTDTELNNLRQIYLKQQRDLQFLHFHLESSEESKEKRRTESQDGSPGMVLSDLEISDERDSLCGEVSRKIPTHFVHFPDCPLKKAGHSCRAQNRQQEQQMERIHEGLFCHPRCLRREEATPSSPRCAGEMEDRLAAQLDVPRKSRSRETVWTSELSTATALPRHKHWFEANFSSCLAPRFFDNSSGDCKDASPDTAGIPPRQRACVPPYPGNHACESACSAGRKASLYQGFSNQEWTEMLKPAENDGSGLWGRESSPSPQDAPELKSDHDGTLNGCDWGAPCFTSTLRSKETKPAEMPSALEYPSDLPGPLGCCQLPTHRDSRSPDDQLQQMWAETRQMVTHLEHRHLLSTSPCSSPASSLHTEGDDPKSVCEQKVPVEEQTRMKRSPFASQERKRSS